METESDFALTGDRYASQTAQRMAHVVRELGAREGNINNIVRQLRKQEAASRLMGFSGIAHLCTAMDDYLAETRRGEPPQLSEAAPLLLEVCKTIQLHAERVDLRPTPPPGS